MKGSATLSHLTVAVIGGGAIGLAIAWRLAQRGAKVTVFDKGAAGSGATHAAAGMLAACAEAEPGEETLVALNRASQLLWPAFADELEKASGMSIGLRTEGTLVLALTTDDQARLKHLLTFQNSLGLPLEWMSAAEVRRREPHLASSVAGAIWSPQDHQVDNRALAAALHRAALAVGATVREHAPVDQVITERGRITGVRVREERSLHTGEVAGGVVPADVVVVAAGAWSRGIGGLPTEARPPVRPVKGQMLSLRMDPKAPLLTHVVWAPGAYLVPRRDGRLLIGATVEEKGFDTTLTAGGQLALLEAAWRAVPSIEELAIDEMWVGFRPGSRDDAPIIGMAPLPGLVYATGHYRNGILLTPITAKAVADLILDGAVDPLVQPFGLDRFALAMAAE
ncbi:MAG: glycine oxidase [Alphaproteobacteria bacterium]|jgi:glycine oxidase|nr:glycine oxidase [Alphaproteobacteria bacterium]MEA2993362.1 glycine oxidase [Alphaproteobacteria bacterium]